MLPAVRKIGTVVYIVPKIGLKLYKFTVHINKCTIIMDLMYYSITGFTKSVNVYSTLKLYQRTVHRNSWYTLYYCALFKTPSRVRNSGVYFTQNHTSSSTLTHREYTFSHS